MEPSKFDINPVPHFQRAGDIIASDASDKYGFAFSVTSQGFVHQEEFTNDECLQSSGFRELTAIFKSISKNPEFFNSTSEQSVKVFYWLTDSQNVHYWMKSGSRIKRVQNLVLELLKILRNLRAKLEVIWVPRTTDQLVIADIGSKFQDTDDWGISDQSLNVLQYIASASFTCDCFATASNARTKKFYSKVASPHCAAINAFTQALDRYL